MISLHRDDKLLQKYKTILNKIKYLKNIELVLLLVYDDKYIKTKIRTYGDKVYTNICSLNMPEDGIECESFIVIYKSKYYLQVYLDNCTYKIVDKQMIDYLDDSLLKADEN